MTVITRWPNEQVIWPAMVGCVWPFSFFANHKYQRGWNGSATGTEGTASSKARPDRVCSIWRPHRERLTESEQAPPRSRRLTARRPRLHPLPLVLPDHVIQCHRPDSQGPREFAALLQSIISNHSEQRVTNESSRSPFFMPLPTPSCPKTQTNLRPARRDVSD